jgi:hypothetical protein
MTIPEILEQITPYTGKYPRAAMEAAVKQQEAITPELVRILESMAAAPAAWLNATDRMDHMFAAYFLAQFREKAAFPLLIKAISGPGDVAEDLFGETVTDGLSQILGSVYDGNAALLQGIVENPDLDEFVRDAALQTHVVLVASGQMSRDDAIAYLRSLFEGKLEREPSCVWSGLAMAVIELAATELMGEARRAYDEGLVDPSVIRLEDYEQETSDPEARTFERRTLISDAIAETEWWAAFDEELHTIESSSPELPPEFVELPASVPYAPPAPYIRGPKTGRNDPCTCGSGKKYKKCCGA